MGLVALRHSGLLNASLALSCEIFENCERLFLRGLTSIATLVLVLGLVAATLRPAMACGICIALAEDTISDRILSAKIVVIAAPDPAHPFRFTPIEVVAGDTAVLDDLPPIPFLVDRAIRAKRRSGEKGAVVMTFGVDRTTRSMVAARLKWHRLFALNDARRQFLERVLEEGQSWSLGRTDDPGKVSFFASQLRQGDPVLYDTALTELSRAPYPVLRAMPEHPPPALLMPNLSRVERAAFAPVTIKLLAADQRARAAAMLRARYLSGIATSGQTLHAWGIAAVETDGKDALALVAQKLNAATTSDTSRRQLILALIDAGTVNPVLREDILEVFDTSLRNNLNGAAEIALAVTDWGEDALDPVFRVLLERDDVNPITAFALQTAIGWDG